MFVSMWMTRNVVTVGTGATLSQIAALMREHQIRRMPVVHPGADGPRLLGMITHSNVLHAFPPDLNPFSIDATSSIAKAERSMGKVKTAADLMTPEPLTTTPDAPIEEAARLMRTHKIGALPVVSDRVLAGIITESDIFDALMEVFEANERAARITFALTPNEDVLPLVAEIAARHSLRVTSFMALPQHAPPVCVVQVAGEKVELALEDVWKSRHRVLNVVNLHAHGGGHR